MKTDKEIQFRKEIKKNFAYNLDYWAKKRNIKQIDIVNILKVSKSTVSTWFNPSNPKMPSTETIQKLANILDINLSDLVDKHNDNIKSNATLIDGIILHNTPLYENVSAGFGTMAIDSIVGYVPLPFNTKSEAEETICIRVDGDSMSPKIENGDIIQVKKQTSVDSGDIAVVLLDGSEGLVKKVEYGSDYIKLISLNLNYPPITLTGESVTRVMVVGKVKKIIRDI